MRNLNKYFLPIANKSDLKNKIKLVNKSTQVIDFKVTINVTLKSIYHSKIVIHPITSFLGFS